MLFPTERFPYTNFHDLNLDWILDQVKKIAEELQRLQQKEDADHDAIAALEKRLDDFIASIDDDYIRKVVDEYLQYGVWFGLTDSGYYVVYIPSGWDDIAFKTTGLDIELEAQPEYGHLVITY